MSFFPLGISLLEASVLNLIAPGLFRTRSIGGIVADITEEEHHTDTLTVTENPVQNGASISDHAFKQPAKVAIRAGWSNSSIQALGDPNYVDTVYAQFLSLQASREPIDVITGKRTYNNMIIETIDEVTDQKTEYALMLRLGIKEVIIVSTQTVTVPPASSMKNPQSNSPTENVGTQSLQSAPNYNPTATP